MFRHSRRWHGAALALLAMAVPRMTTAQTDYYNLDAGRPLRIEDALVIERHALEWQVAPFRLAGAGRKTRAFGLEPELAWGALPRTQVELGVPLLFPRGGASGAAGVELSALHALNAETTGWPGLALGAGVHLPAGPHGPERSRVELTAVATRTLALGRVHANATVVPGRLTVGDDEAVRWRAGLAADRTFPLRSFLLGAELVAEQPAGAAPVRWSSAVGTRYQVGPRSAIDFGVGRTIERRGEWFVTMGSALSFGLLHRLGGVR